MQSKSRSIHTLGVVLAFVLGCLCGRAVFGLLRPAKTPPEAQPAQRLTSDNAWQGSAPTASENGPNSLERALTASELDGLAAQREPAAAVEAGPGIGVLSGTVRGLAGEPLSGVRLVAASAVLSRVQGAGQIGNGVFDPRSTWLAQRSQLIPSGGTEALTDAEGHFEIAVQEGRLYQLSAHLAGWILQPLGGSADAVSAGQKLDFRGQPAAQLQLDLVDEQGQPLEQASVALCSSLEHGVPWSYLEWRRASPTIDLPPGSWRLCALTGGRIWVQSPELLQLPERISKPAELELSAAAGPILARWVLAPACVLYGQLEPPPEDPGVLADYLVRLVATSGDAAVDPFGHWLPPGRVAWPHSGSHYQVFACVPGTYQVEFKRHYQGEWQALGSVDLPQAPLRQDFQLGAAFAAPRLEIDALDPNGAPAASLGRISVTTKANNSSSGQQVPLAQVQLLAAGRFSVPLPSGLKPWFEGQPGASVPFPGIPLFATPAPDTAGAVLLGLDHPVYGKYELPVTPGQKELYVRFRQPARLLLSVKGNYRPPGQAWLSVLVAAGPKAPFFTNVGLPRRLALGAGETTLEFAGLAPGPTQLSLVLNKPTSGGGHSSVELEHRSLDLGPGDNLVTMDLVGMGGLRVRHPVQRTGQIGARRQDPDGSFGSHDYMPNSAQVDAEGWAAFEVLAPGRYLLRDDAGDLMSVNVPCGEVWFEPRAPDCVSLVLGSEANVLLEAGLRSGDLLLEFDGQPLSSTLLQETRSLAQKEPGRQLTVGYQRGGSRSTARVPASALLVGGFKDVMLIPNLRP
jgi:hypothetical protein